MRSALCQTKLLKYQTETENQVRIKVTDGDEQIIRHVHVNDF